MHTITMWSILLLLAAGQGIFMSAVLFVYRRPNPLPNRLLAVVFLILSMEMIQILMLETGLYTRLPHLLWIYSPFMVLIGPLIYFYIKSLLDEQFRFRVEDSVHLIACLFTIVRRLPLYLKTSEEKIGIVETMLSTSPMRMSAQGYLNLFLLTGILMAYVYFAYRYLKNYGTHNTSSKDFKVSWLKKFVLIYILYSIIGLLGTILLFAFEAFTIVIDNSMVTANALILFTMGYLTLIYPEIYSGLQRKKTAIKYEKSALPADYTKSIISKLQHLMETEKPYLSDDLRLSSLAEMLSVSANHLSQSMNQELQMSFHDFVNQYRIAEARTKLADRSNKHYTILGLALDVGFNNKSSFNRAFKKHTGITPSAFLKAKR